MWSCNAGAVMKCVVTVTTLIVTTVTGHQPSRHSGALQYCIGHCIYCNQDPLIFWLVQNCHLSVFSLVSVLWLVLWGQILQTRSCGRRQVSVTRSRTSGHVRQLGRRNQLFPLLIQLPHPGRGEKEVIETFLIFSFINLKWIFHWNVEINFPFLYLWKP